MYYRFLFTSVLENKSRKVGRQAEFLPEGLIDHTPRRKLTLVERGRGKHASLPRCQEKSGKNADDDDDDGDGGSGGSGRSH